MDIELIERKVAELMRWKARVSPMLEEMLPEYGAHVAASKAADPAAPGAEVLRKAIHAPLHDATPEEEAAAEAVRQAPGREPTEAEAKTREAEELHRRIHAPLHPPTDEELKARTSGGPAAGSGNADDDAYRARILAHPGLTDAHRQAAQIASGAGLDSIGRAVGVERR